MTPNIDLIPDDNDLELIKTFDENLLDSSKWNRFKMTGPNQGSYGRYGYWDEIVNNESIRHFYIVELYSFESVPQNHQIFYKNVFIVHELDENKNIIDSGICLDGGNNYPMTAKNAMSKDMNLTSTITITFDDNLFE